MSRTLGNIEWHEFRQNLYKSDDRSCAILSASYIDNCLELVIRKALSGNHKIIEELLSETMPLGTFSAKSKIAFCLGLISEDIFLDITRIRKIRNKFGHKFINLSFESDPIRNWCMELNSHKSVTKISISNALIDNPRDRFIMNSTLIMNALELRSCFLSPKLNEFITNLKSDELDEYSLL